MRAPGSPTSPEPLSTAVDGTGRAPGQAWGAYCLANDAVLDWTIALFASLRSFAPELPLLVIPFDRRQEALSREVERFGYDYLPVEAADEFSAIGRQFYPDDPFAAGGFRKLAAFGGPFARFFALDSDVLLLSPLDDFMHAFEASAFDLVHFDTDVEQVYRPGPLRAELEARGRARGFNAGLFAARRGLLDARRLRAALADLDAAWTGTLVANAEQPFLNLFADRAEWALGFAHELTAGFCSTCWSAVGRLALEGGEWRLRDSNRWDEGWRLRFAHWAGIRLDPAMPNRAAWERFRSM